MKNNSVNSFDRIKKTFGQTPQRLPVKRRSSAKSKSSRSLNYHMNIENDQQYTIDIDSEDESQIISQSSPTKRRKQYFTKTQPLLNVLNTSSYDINDDTCSSIEYNPDEVSGNCNGCFTAKSKHNKILTIKSRTNTPSTAHAASLLKSTAGNSSDFSRTTFSSRLFNIERTLNAQHHFQICDTDSEGFSTQLNTQSTRLSTQMQPQSDALNSSTAHADTPHKAAASSSAFSRKNVSSRLFNIERTLNANNHIQVYDTDSEGFPTQLNTRLSTQKQPQIEEDSNPNSSFW